MEVEKEVDISEQQVHPSPPPPQNPLLVNCFCQSETQAELA